ncbi:MAG: GAF domain-containing protein [Candidatus Omnitrophica bacterium]|nr:GAF domain-containing protein [Candidatus Omnitrophota bacterium]
MNYFAFSGLVNFIACAFLGVFVFNQNRKNPQNISYFILNVSVAVYSIGYFLWQIDYLGESVIWFKVLVAGIILINPSYLLFVFIFLNIIRKKTPTLLVIALVNIFFIAACVKESLWSGFVPKFGLGLWPVPSRLFSLYLVFWAFQCLYGFYYLGKNLRVGSHKRRLQIRYFTIAAFVGFIGGATNWPMWYGLYFPPYPNILISLYIAIVAYAIVRHELMDIEIIVKRSIVFAGLFFVLYSVFSLIVYISSLSYVRFTDNRFVSIIPSVIIIIIMFRPLEKYLIKITDNYLFQKRYDYKVLLRSFTNNLLSIMDLKKLIITAEEQITSIVRISNAAILVYDRHTDIFSLFAGAGDLKNKAFTLKNTAELWDYILRKDAYAVISSENKERDDIPVILVDLIKSLNSSLIIPLIYQNDVLGILSLGMKLSDEEYSQEDIDILVPVSITLSIAIANAKLFEQLSETQAQAAQREKMAVVGTLSAGINHEICNPLGIIRGQCEAFMLNYQGGFYKNKSDKELLTRSLEIMTKVIRETERASSITQKLSSFAKPSKGQMSASVSIKKELKEVIALVEHELKISNIELKDNVPDDLPRITIDTKQLQEILFNLISNAAQAIVENGEIEISGTYDADKVTIRISDNGPGIREEILKKIFEPFFTTKDPGKGTGLGLFIVKQIIEKNSGIITVNSETGKGTVFLVMFPFVEGA